MRTTVPRYQKQLLLPELGESGQARLAEARVLVIGAGGLGCPALQYLAAAGVGCVGIADFDVVDLSNLHRQILYQAEDVGAPKAEIAERRIQALNPDVQVEVFQEAISTENALEILTRFDIVVDGSDNFPTGIWSTTPAYCWTNRWCTAPFSGLKARWAFLMSWKTG
jgi:molybdopterin/thiamine biosynthesis adenylyltransferase